MQVCRQRNRFWLLIGYLALIGMGCAHVVSEPLRQQADTTLSFAELRANPEAFKGHTVILGGRFYRRPTYAKAHGSRSCNAP